MTFAFIAISVQAQKKVRFKQRYLPGNVYNSTSRMEMLIEANDGKEAPAEVANVNFTSITATAGKVKAGNPFPMTFRLNKTEAKVVAQEQEQIYGPDPNPLNGKSVALSAPAEDKPEIDTLSGTPEEQALKKVVRTFVNETFSRVKFPDKPLAVGDTFTDETNWDIDVMVKLEAPLKTVYKLVEIKAGKAFFEMSSTLALEHQHEVKGIKVFTKAKSAGKGKFVYNLANNFITAFDNVVGIDLDLQAPEKAMKISSNTRLTISARTEITKD